VAAGAEPLLVRGPGDAVRQQYGLSTELITFARGEVPAMAAPAARVPEAIGPYRNCTALRRDR